jgi:nitric oxide reductase subunit B
MDVMQNGYWHARGPEFLKSLHIIEWLRLPGDLVFIGLGIVPVCVAAALTYGFMRRSGREAGNQDRIPG